MPRIYGPDGNWIDFPEGTDQGTIKSVMARYYGAPGQKPTAQLPSRQPAPVAAPAPQAAPQPTAAQPPAPARAAPRPAAPAPKEEPGFFDRAWSTVKAVGSEAASNTLDLLSGAFAGGMGRDKPVVIPQGRPQATSTTAMVTQKLRQAGVAPQFNAEANKALRTIPRNAVQGVLPGVAGVGGFALGAQAAAPVAGFVAPFTGPAAPITAGVITLGGGLAGALGLSSAATALQDKAIDAAPTDFTAPLGIDKAQRERDMAEHPYASTVGRLLPGFAFGVPGATKLPVREGATAMERVFANPVTGAAAGATINAATDAGMQYASTGKVDPTLVAISAAAGATQNRQTRLGASISEAAARAGGATAQAASTIFSRAYNEFQARRAGMTGADAQSPHGFATAPDNLQEGAWRYDDTGNVVHPDGRPFAWQTPQEAARWAARNKMGDHELALSESGQDGSQRYIWRRYAGQTEQARPGTAAEPAGAEAVSGQLPSTELNPDPAQVTGQVSTPGAPRVEVPSPAAAGAPEPGNTALSIVAWNKGKGEHTDGFGLSDGTVATLSDGNRVMLWGVESGVGKFRAKQWDMRTLVNGKMTNARLGPAKNQAEAAQRAIQMVEWLKQNPDLVGSNGISYSDIAKSQQGIDPAAASIAPPAPAALPVDPDVAAYMAEYSRFRDANHMNKVDAEAQRLAAAEGAQSISRDHMMRAAMKVDDEANAANSGLPAPKAATPPDDLGTYHRSKLTNIEDFTLPNPRKDWQGVPDAEVSVAQAPSGGWVYRHAFNGPMGGHARPFGSDVEYATREEALKRGLWELAVKTAQGYFDDPATVKAKDRVRRWIRKQEAALGQAQPAAKAEPVDQPTAQPIKPRAVGEGQMTVTVPATGKKVNTQFQLVEGNDLRYAEGQNQNRDRSRVSTSSQIQSIIGSFDPTQLGVDAYTDRGAPIIGKDGTILSGNGRVMVLNAIYDNYPELAAKYRQFIEDQGFDTTGLERPILTRGLMDDLSPEELRSLVVGSNKDNKQAMSAPEIALQDAADVLRPELMAKFVGGSITKASNGEFVRGFMEALSESERAAMRDSSGNLSTQGVERIENAIMARAYGGGNDNAQSFLRRALEQTDDDAKTLTGALTEAAPDWLRLREAIQGGEVMPQYDITDNLMDAIAQIRAIKQRGLTVADWLRTEDMFNSVDPLTKQILLAFHNDKITRFLSKQKIAGILEHYAALAGEQQTGEDMFGMKVEAPSPEELLRSIINSDDGQLTMIAAEDRLPMADMLDAPGRNQPTGRGVPTTAEEVSREEIGGPPTSADAMEDRSGISSDPKGGYQTKFIEASFTNRTSIYEGAMWAAGVEPDKFRLLAPERQAKLLSEALTRLTGIEVILDNGMNLRMAIDQLLDAHQTLQGMAYALGVSPRALSLDGNLKLKLLKKGGFLGVYYPDENAIGLPGRSNSFAHEWSHALDFYLLKEFGADGRGLSGAIRKEGGDIVPTNLREAFVNLMNAMFFDKAEMAKQIMDLEAKIAKSKSDKRKAELQAKIDRLRGGNSQMKSGRTQLYQNAKDMDGSTREYWQSPTEMMARSFEAYVGMLVQTEGFGHEFIGKGNENYLSNLEERFAKTFPKGQERERIFQAFSDVMMHLNREAMLEGSDGYRPNMDEIVKLTDFDRLVETVENGSLLQREREAISRELRKRQRAAKDRASDPKSVANRVEDVWSTAFYSMAGKLKMLERRYNSRAIKEIYDKLTHTPGSGQYTGRTFHEAVSKSRNQNLNRVSNILKANGLMDMTDDEMRMLRDALISERNDAMPENIIKAASGLRQLVDAEWYRNTNAGVKLGYARGVGYLKRMIDLPKVMLKPEAFKADAGKVYEIVFNREFGEDADAILSQDNGLRNFMRMAKKYDVDGLDELRKLNKQISSLESAQKTSDDPDLIAARLEPLYAKRVELMDEMLDPVREGYAAERAEAWLAKMTQAAEYDFDAHSPDNSYTKSRELPPEADKLLENFYLQNPVEALITYFEQSARRVAYAERFGAESEKLKKLIERMGAEGVPVEDQQEVIRMVNIATGRVSSNVPRSVQRFLSLIHTAGTLALLPRAVLSSLTEAGTAGIAAGDLREGIRAFSATLVGAKSLNGKQRAELARAMGIVTDAATETVLDDRFGGTYGEVTRFDMMNQRMFENTGLTQLTRAQRTHTLAASHAFLDNLAGKALDGDKDAIAMLQELGVSDVPVWATELRDKGRMPTVEELDTAWGDEYSLASLRFMDMTIMQPNAMDRPILAQNPVGRIVYGITSFSSAYWRNVLKRNAIMTAQIYKRNGGGKTGAQKAAAHATLGFLPAVLLMLVLQGTISTLREWLLNRERWDELKKQGKLEETLVPLAVTRTLSFGMFDPFIQAVTGLKYQRDLSNVMVGAAPGFFLQSVQGVMNSFIRDSDKTNTAEYNRDKAIYSGFIAPALSMGLSLLPGGPILRSSYGVAQAAATSPRAGSAFATAIEGPKGSKTDPKTGEVIGPPPKKKEK